ncbi:MAG TPA: hypothetical protein VJR94_07575 [Candidatus Nitrosocosmicus sp.]|nr:hypothetical protein [Candidatus Nitrosocosmicus sp.]
MTDDSKEFAFSSVKRWLREANFVIKEEKSTIVTSDFYAKMLSPVYPLHPIDLKSNPSLGNGILIQVSLTLTPKQITCFTNLDGKLKLDIVKEISSPHNSSKLILTDSGDMLILERMITFGSQLLESKHELIDLISGMLETINNLQKIA